MALLVRVPCALLILGQIHVALPSLARLSCKVSDPGPTVKPVSRHESGQPPIAPWVPLVDTGRGYLSVYLSDKLARWPVRDITRRADNKSDPNIETMTYGLFSTCEPQMRNRIVQDGAATLFFVTRHRHKERVLTGYYHLGWYTEGTRGAENRDFALAASTVRFIGPIPLSELPGNLAEECGSWFRTQKPVAVSSAAALRKVVDGREDRTEEYRQEVARLERFASSRTGFAYPSWGRKSGFTWQDAPEFYKRDGAVAKAPNSTRSRRWRCNDCGYVIPNVALLKQCPVCQSMASLVPED
jgi:hypothetical protein